VIYIAKGGMGTDRVHAERFVSSYTPCEEVDEKYLLKMTSPGNPVASLGQIFDCSYVDLHVPMK
jgi:hypothetical protein